MRKAKVSSSKSFSITSVYWNYFTHGDKFILSGNGDLEVTVASFKEKVSRSGYSDTTTDIFSSPNRPSGRDNYMEFVVIGTGLVASGDSTTWGETYETDPVTYSAGFTVEK